MPLLSHVTVLWSMVAAGALLFGLMHLVRWILDREARADLAFAIVAFSFVAVAYTELGGMHATSPEQWGYWVRWEHLPLCGLLIGTVAFVHFYLGTARLWLMWSYIGLRVVIVLLNFAWEPNFNFEEILTIERIRFLGQDVSVVGEAVTGPWQALGLLSTVLLAAFVVDATVTLWRRGGEEDRRRAIVIGGGLSAFVLLAGVHTQLVIWREITHPFLITPPFLIPLLAMAFELGRDMLRAAPIARELRESQRRLELAAEAAELGFCEWDSGSDRMWATREAREIFGLSEAESGRYASWLAKVHPDDSARLIREMQRALDSGKDYGLEFRVNLPGSGPRWVFARGRAETAAPGGPALVRGVIRDVSEQHRTLDETLALRQELAHAGRVSMLGQLASSLAHELSQPLGAILRNAEAAGLLLDARAPDLEELKAIVADIQRDDRRARDVIDRLRAMLKRRDAAIQSVATDGLIDDVLDLVRADAASRGVTLEHVRADEPLGVAGDRVQLSQVLLNLVLNAMDAVADRPPAERIVQLGARRVGTAFVDMRVSDSGAGIPAGREGRIFEPFYTTKASGMGLGLAISRTIAESHGGSLSVEQGALGGATFCLQLPIEEALRS